MVIVLASSAVLIWLYLLCGRGKFWLGSERDDHALADIASWPRIVALIPARNEADCIDASVTSLLRQDYPGRLSVLVVDDDSSDDTANVARRAAAAVGEDDRLAVITSNPLPAGWTGKLWALKQGVELTAASPDRPEYLLLTDADIVYSVDAVRRLVARARTESLVLASLMAKLRCESLAERIHVPAFIFFFQMLYPFRWVNRADRKTAAAAGGCVLVRLDALTKAGGIDAIRGDLIDDCALAGMLKRQGRIWLGLTDRVRSIRRYGGSSDIRRMVSRSAYAQLRYSPVLLLTALAGMVVTYLMPPLLAAFAGGVAGVLGVLGWVMMAIAFQPTLRFYRLSPLWGIALPGIALLYMLYTLDSAYQYARGHGGIWKGRVQANLSGR